MNSLKTWVLMAALTAILIVIGGVIGGRGGALIALVIGLVMNGASYFFSDQIAISMAGAQPASETNYPQLYTLVRHLTNRAGLPMPRLYVSPSDQPNAFATGRDPQHAAVVVNAGLMHLLSERELAGVLAHEISHIRHRDILIASMAATLAGAITWIAQMLQWEMFWGGTGDRRDQNVLADLALMILAPIAATMVQLAISRSREFKADAGAAHLTQDPDGLADALAKLDHAPRFGYTNTNRQKRPSTAAAAMAHMYIVNPLRGQQIANLFSTHPATEERIRRLRLMRIGN